MKKVTVVGILMAAILCWPVKVQAAEAVFPRTHEIQVNEFTYEEAQMLLKIGQAEAGNQGPDGVWLVMSVIYNRRASDVFPNSIEEVIYQDNQFYTKGMGATEVSADCHEALARIERGDVAPLIVAFEKKSSKSLDVYFTPAFTYRDHAFYTLNE